MLSSQQTFKNNSYQKGMQDIARHNTPSLWHVLSCVVLCCRVPDACLGSRDDTNLWPMSLKYISKCKLHLTVRARPQFLSSEKLPRRAQPTRSEKPPCSTPAPHQHPLTHIDM